MSAPSGADAGRGDGAGRDLAAPPAFSCADAIALMRQTAVALSPLIDAFPEARLGERPVPAEWSAAEILRHMVVVEDLLARRVDAMVASDSVPHGGGPADQAEEPDARELLARWVAARGRTLERLARLTPEDLRHGAELRHWGHVSVEEQVCEWAYHDLEHLRQLLANLEAFAYPSIGGFTGLYAPPYPAPEGVTP